MSACGLAWPVEVQDLYTDVVEVQDLYRVTSLIRNRAPLGPYISPMPRDLWWFLGMGVFLMSEVPMYFEAQELYPNEDGDAADHLDDRNFLRPST